MYEKKSLNVNVNLFPNLDMSNDAQRLLSAWVIGGAGKGVINQGARMSNRIIGSAVEVVGMAGVGLAVNEAVDVVFGIDMAEIVANAVADGVNAVRNFVDERRAQKADGEPAPEVIDDYEE